MSQSDRLPPGQQLISDERWPVVGERGPHGVVTPWTVEIAGLLSGSQRWTLDELNSLPQVEQRIDIHCVTRWSKLDVSFSGIPLDRLMPREQIDPTTKFISFVARSQRNHSTSLRVDQVYPANPLIALRAGGLPLTREHGGPIRMVVPGKYFYKSVKWLSRVECLAADRLGYWEADAGYHNSADPWREERYVAADISKQQAARLIGNRDFTGMDLLSVDLSARELAGLVARSAMLRNANFQDADLRQSDFGESNLSNAHFQRANLQGARFLGADIEGANFAGADLRGADLRVASMFGASFCLVDSVGRVSQPALIDQTTRLNPEKFTALTTEQERFMRQVSRRV